MIDKREDVICAKVWLQPGSEARVREWASHINAHRTEALQTLQEEGVTIESVFYDPTPDGPCLIYYMRSASQEHAMAVAAQSAHAIDAYHQAFKRETWVKVERLELLLDLVQDAAPASALPSPQ
ncbi:MAG: DUF6176 family protein [Pseudomonadota bacterium]